MRARCMEGTGAGERKPGGSETDAVVGFEGGEWFLPEGLVGSSAVAKLWLGGLIIGVAFESAGCERTVGVDVAVVGDGKGDDGEVGSSGVFAGSNR